MILIAIGFIADTITIASLGSNQSNPSNSLLVLAFFVMIYIWFAIGWLLLNHWAKKSSFEEYGFEIEKVTFGLGLILYPITFLIMYQTDDVNARFAFFFLHLLIALIIYFSLRFIITLIYPKLNKITFKFLSDSSANEYSWYGKWICIHSYKSDTSGEEFKKNDFIVTYYDEKQDATENYSYLSSYGKRSEIHFSELNAYWEYQNKSKE